jgi:RHS repeat-associated protein
VTTTYGYDLASQLTSATPSTGLATSWTYDKIGQRATETVGTATTGYQYDTAGQLCWTTTAAMPTTPACATPPTGATTYTHDSAGRILTETVTATNKVTYTYDPAGQLATAQRVNGTTTTTQTRTYNVTNQLAGLTNVTGAATTASTLDWDPTSTAAHLAAITASGATTDTVIGLTGWAAARSGATNNAVGSDVYGSTVTTTSTAGLARSASYTSQGAAAGASTFEPRLGYRGELTSDGLVYLRARSFQPSLGRFTSTDPAPGRPGSTTVDNEYSYANNRPMQVVDPLGLFGIGEEAGGTGIGSADGLNEPGHQAAGYSAEVGSGEPGLGAVLDTLGAAATAALPGQLWRDLTEQGWNYFQRLNFYYWMHRLVQLHIAAQVPGGRTECHIPGVGRADVCSGSFVAEVKPLGGAKDGFDQLTGYLGGVFGYQRATPGQNGWPEGGSVGVLATPFSVSYLANPAWPGVYEWWHTGGPIPAWKDWKATERQKVKTYASSMAIAINESINPAPAQVTIGGILAVWVAAKAWSWACGPGVVVCAIVG